MSKTKTIYILAFAIVIIIGVIIYSNINQEPTQINAYKCPETYGEDVVGTKEYREDVTDWTSEFFKANPRATMSES